MSKEFKVAEPYVKTIEISEENTELTVTELRDSIDIEKIKTFIGKFKFGLNGACDDIAKMIGNDLDTRGGMESCYYDCISEEEKKRVRFLYERRNTSNNGIPHRIIELFTAEDNLKYIGKIDLPFGLYEAIEIIDIRRDKFKWSRKESYKYISKDDVIIDLCKPQKFSPTLIELFE